MKPFARNSLLKFAKNLKAARREAGLTQEQLAEMVGITPRNIQKLEAADMSPTFGVLVALRKSLKAEWDDLLGGV